MVLGYAVCAAELFGEEDGSVPATFQVRATSSQTALTGDCEIRVVGLGADSGGDGCGGGAGGVHDRLVSA